MTSDEQEIRQLPVAWMEATQTGDVETVLSLMSDEGVFLRPGHPPMGKDEFAAGSRAMAETGGPQIEGSSDVQEVQIFGDMAYMWNNLTVNITPPDGSPSVTHQGPVLTVLKKENGKWVLWRDANMLVAVQKERS